MTDEKQIYEKKFRTQFVIIWKGHYFGLDFDNREIRKITFNKAFGCSFFDWDNNISISDDFMTAKYDYARGKDGCGILSKRFFCNRNDLLDFNNKLYKQFLK